MQNTPASYDRKAVLNALYAQLVAAQEAVACADCPQAAAYLATAKQTVKSALAQVKRSEP